MKTSLSRTLCAIALAGLFAAPAAADSNFGVKLGQFSVDGDDSAATQVGLVYTWDIVGVFGIEGEINTSAKKGEFTVFPLPPQEYGVSQLGAYGVVMSPGPFYFKGKAGYVYTDVDFPGADASTDLAYGVGIGFELIGFVWEVEYTKADADGNDADFISVSFKF